MTSANPVPSIPEAPRRELGSVANSSQAAGFIAGIPPVYLAPAQSTGRTVSSQALRQRPTPAVAGQLATAVF